MARKPRKTPLQRELDKLLAPVKGLGKDLAAIEKKPSYKRHQAAADRAAVLEAQQEVIDRHSLGMSTTAFVSKPTATKIKKEIRTPERIRARQAAQRRAFLNAGFMNRSVATVFNAPMGMGIFAAGTGQDIWDLGRHGDPDFERTRENLKQAGIGAYESLKHPGRDPAAALLTLYGVASLGATGVAKLSVTRTLAAQGEYLKAAKAMGRKPPPGPRILKSPDGLEVRSYGGYSRSALAEVWQRTHDYYLQAGARRNPGGRINRQLDVRIERELRKQEIVEKAKNTGEVVALSRHHLTTPQQLAVRMYAENSTPAEVFAELDRALARETNPAKAADIRLNRLLFQRASLYLNQDTFGNVFLSGKKGKKLKAAIEEAGIVAEDRTALLKSIDRLTDEAAENRVSAPGRVRRGAEFVETTDARLGIPTPQLLAKRARERRLARAYESAVARKEKGAKQSYVLVDEAGNERALANMWDPPVITTRPRTAEEAGARLAQLEKWWDDLVEATYKQEMEPSAVQAENRRRFGYNARRRGQIERGEDPGRVLDRPNEARPIREQESLEAEGQWHRVEGAESWQAGSIGDEVRQAARARLYQWAETGKSAEAAKLRARLDEMERLGEEITKHAEQSLGWEEGGPANFGVVTEQAGEQIPKGYKVRPTDMPRQEILTSPSVERRGAALSVARDELEQAERAAANRVEPTGLVGGEGGPRGRFRVPYKPTRFTRRGSGATGASGVLGDPKELASTVNSYKGSLQRSGRYRKATTKLIADDAMEAMTFRSTLRRIATFKEGARPVQREGDMAVRFNTTIPPEVRKLLNEAEEGVKLSREEKRALGAAYKDFEKRAFPERHDYTADDIVNGEIGFIPRTWLTGRELKTIPLGGAPNVRGLNYLPIWDDINNAAKLVLIYGKIGYIPPNLLGNVILNAIQQGPLALPNLAKSAALSRSMSPSDAGWVDGLMGAGIAKSLIGEDQGALGWVTRKVADVVSIPTDRFTRRSSFLYEASRRGYGSRKKIRELREAVKRGDVEATHHLNEIVARARNNAIEYENLTYLEKQVVRRLVFIYPWVKGSTTYTGRFLRDHPIQAAFYYQLGARYRDQADNMSPSFMEGQGRVGGTDERPQMLDLRGASPWSTFGDIAGTGMAIAQGKFPTRFIPAEFITPPLQIGAGWLFQFNPQTRTPLEGQSFRKYLKESFLDTSPPAQVLGAIRGDQPSENKIVQRSRNEQIGRVFLGSLAPATQSRANREAAAIDEAKGLLPVDKRAIFKVREERNKMEAALARVGAEESFVDGRLHPKLEAAWHLRALAAAAVAGIHKPRRATRKQDLEYQLARQAAEWDLAERLGIQTKYPRAEVIAWAHRQTDPRVISRDRTYFRANYFGGDFIKSVRKFTKENHPNYDER